MVLAAEERKIKELRKKRRVKILRAIGTMLALILSNVTVLLMGTYLFHYLESYQEIEDCFSHRKSYSELSNTTSNLMMLKAADLHAGKVVSDEAKVLVKDAYKEYLVDFAKQVKKLKHNPQFNCGNLSTNASWTIDSSLVFSLSVITTIGKFVQINR